MLKRSFVPLLALSVLHPSYSQAPPSAVRAIIDSPQFEAAAAHIAKDHDRFVRELVTLTEIPAPPFKEQARARAYLDLLRRHGLSDVEMDPEGNVMGVRKGTGGANAGMLAVVAHLDTVFPEGTDVTVRREGTRLMAPGIGDNTRGAALILAIIRAMDAGKFRTTSDILFVGNVGEEGEGDLRGVKYLLQKGKYKDRIRQFIAIDGGGQGSITRGGVGSRRYRVTFKGPGGHSYGAFGLVNPAFAMGNAIHRFSRLQVPAKPRTTFNVGVVSGGTSVNSIPSSVSMDVDLRSEACDALQQVDEEFRALLKLAVEDENRARSTAEGRIEVDPKVIGDRPCGETSLDAPILQTASAAVSAFGLTPTYGIGSTDANVPMNLGIPALTIGRGGEGDRTHSPDEWTDVAPEAQAQAVQVAMTIILAVAGVAGSSP